MRAHDAVAADAFKRRMTARFQETVAALEASGAAEKHQLSAMHQQRVQVRIYTLNNVQNFVCNHDFDISARTAPPLLSYNRTK